MPPKIYAVNYMCYDCNQKSELWFDRDADEEPETPFKCGVCGGEVHRFNFKDNAQVWGYMDNRGGE